MEIADVSAVAPFPVLLEAAEALPCLPPGPRGRMCTVSCFFRRHGADRSSSMPPFTRCNVTASAPETPNFAAMRCTTVLAVSSACTSLSVPCEPERLRYWIWKLGDGDVGKGDEGGVGDSGGEAGGGPGEGEGAPPALSLHGCERMGS